MMRHGIFSMRWASASRGSVSGSRDSCWVFSSPCFCLKSYAGRRWRHTRDVIVTWLSCCCRPSSRRCCAGWCRLGRQTRRCAARWWGWTRCRWWWRRGRCTAGACRSRARCIASHPVSTVHTHTHTHTHSQPFTVQHGTWTCTVSPTILVY